MKKHLAMLVALLLVVAAAVPAFAVDFKYGGEFRVRWISNDNNLDGWDTHNDNQNLVDQRERLYFSFIASENLKVVTKFETGDTTWGARANRNGPGSGGGVGADGTSVEVKNAYVEFNIPNTPTTAIVGIQGINLLSSWIVDDDFAAAVLKTKLDPFTVTIGYIGAQNSTNDPAPGAPDFGITRWRDNIDDWYVDLGYKGGPLSADVVGFYQNGHGTGASIFEHIGPTTTPVPVIPIDPTIDQNDLFDIGVNVTYKMSWMSAYANFVKNLGSVSSRVAGVSDADYTGWMIDAGVNFFCGPYTFNLGGFYTSGNELETNPNSPNFLGFKHPDEQNAFVNPLATSKYFSEIVGGGILDNNAAVGNRTAPGGWTSQWTGYQMPSNVWTVTGGAAWQVLEKTKISGSYWYFGTSEDVVSNIDINGNVSFANDIGHEFDLYITQGIVDGLTLDLVGAYLIAGDAFNVTGPGMSKDNAYEVGARLLWAF